MPEPACPGANRSFLPGANFDTDLIHLCSIFELYLKVPIKYNGIYYWISNSKYRVMENVVKNPLHGLTQIN